jgi:hypothetical protein
MLAVTEQARSHAAALQARLDALQAELEAAAVRESSARSELQQLAGQFVAFREQAADHALVEAALQELRLASVPKQSVAALEQVVQDLRATVMSLQATVRAQAARLEEAEALQAELRQQAAAMAQELRAQRDDDALGRQLQALAARQEEHEGRCGLYHRAFETAADRLHGRTATLSAGHEALLTWRDHHNDGMLRLQGDVAQLSEQLASVASMGPQVLALRVSEQCEGTKAHCAMLCTRAGEVQSEKMAAFEKRVAAEYRKVVAEVQARLDEGTTAAGDRSAARDELDLARLQSGQALRLAEDMRQRVAELERGQAEVASLLEFEEARVQQLSEIRRRIDVLEGRLKLINY